MIGENLTQRWFQPCLIFINRLHLYFYQTFFPKGYEKPLL